VWLTIALAMPTWGVLNPGRDVSLDHAGIQLHGTACVPRDGRLLTVLMLHGSGPMDRDQNMPGQRLDVFNTIAARLSAIGVASVRYDKRGCSASTGNFHRTGFRDLVADAVAWVDWLKTADFVDPARIVLLGHSEGCLVAAKVAVERPIVAGAALLCPFVEDMRSVLMRQAAQVEREMRAVSGINKWFNRALFRLGGSPTDNQRRVIDIVRGTTTDTIRFKRQMIPAKWLRELMAEDPPAVFRQVACPLLLVGGAKDLQCDPEDVARIASFVRGPVESHVVPDLTHLLRRDDRPASMLGASALLDKPIDPAILELVDAWVAGLR
jgi:pimeloyl-ACP methyl ester carboxylesterase